MSSPVFKIIALDDHPFMTSGLKAILEVSPKFDLQATAHTWQELLSKLQQFPTDIAILDLNIHGSSILDKIEPLKKQFPKVKLLIFSSYNTPSLVKKAFATDIDGYLLKDTTQEELLEALETISEGKTYIGSRVAVPKNKKNISEKEEALIFQSSIGLYWTWVYSSGRIHGLGDELSYFTALSKKVIQKIKMMFFLNYGEVCINT